MSAEKSLLAKEQRRRLTRTENLDREVAQKALRPTPRKKANLIVNFVRLQRERENANCVQKMVILTKICFSGRKKST